MLRQPVSSDYKAITVNGQLFKTDEEAAAHAIQLAKQGQIAKFSSRIDHDAYQEALTTYKLYLSAIRATEKELAALRTAASKLQGKALDRIRKQYVTVRHGGLVKAQLAKCMNHADAERAKIKQSYTILQWDAATKSYRYRLTRDITAMERAIQLVPTKQRIARLTTILAHWPKFDTTGLAMIETTRSTVMEQHAEAAKACQNIRDMEYDQAAILTTDIRTNDKGEVVEVRTKDFNPPLEQPDWDKVMQLDDPMKEVNRILYTPPISRDDSRLVARLRAKRNPDMLDKTVTDGTLSYELLVASGFDMAAEG